MFLEKIRENSGKISFLAINALLVWMVVLYIKQQKLQSFLETTLALRASNLNAAISDAFAADVQTLQEGIASNRQQKIGSIAKNPAMVKRQKTVVVTKIIPGATRKVTVPADSSSSTTATKTVKGPAPVKSTKTS